MAYSQHTSPTPVSFLLNLCEGHVNLWTHGHAVQKTIILFVGNDHDMRQVKYKLAKLTLYLILTLLRIENS